MVLASVEEHQGGSCMARGGEGFGRRWILCYGGGMKRLRPRRDSLEHGGCGCGGGTAREGPGWPELEKTEAAAMAMGRGPEKLRARGRAARGLGTARGAREVYL